MYRAYFFKLAAGVVKFDAVNVLTVDSSYMLRFLCYNVAPWCVVCLSRSKFVLCDVNGGYAVNCFPGIDLCRSLLWGCCAILVLPSAGVFIGTVVGCVREWASDDLC